MTARILFIEDSADDLLLVAEEIRRADIDLDVRVIGDRDGLLAALDDGPWSAIVASDNLRGWTGTEALQLVRARDPEMPFLLVSGTKRLGPAILRELRGLGPDARIERLAATVAHEFNNVLMGISPFLEIVRRNPSPERVSMALEQIQRAIERGKRVTADILRFTR